jgi:hypothetical protein
MEPPDVVVAEALPDDELAVSVKFCAYAMWLAQSIARKAARQKMNFRDIMPIILLAPFGVRSRFHPLE